MKTLYVDMDDVLAQFTGKVEATPVEVKEAYNNECDLIPHFFADLEPVEGAVEAYHRLSAQFDTYILSAGSWHNPTAWSDKLLWVKRHLPEVARKRLILCHRKDLLRGDFLVDDRTVNGASEFEGEHIHFGTGQFPTWEIVVSYLEARAG